MKGLILLIDDNPMDVKAISKAIEAQGFVAQGFTEHQKALTWLNDNTPQIIFLDLQMPNISGYELIEQFRHQKRFKNTPIVIVSGKTQTQDIMKAIQLGATDYVVKPIDPLVVQEKLNKLTGAQEGNFFSVDLTENQKIEALLTRKIVVQTLSEFGINFISFSPIEENQSIELAGLPKAIFGEDKLLLRCLTCKKLNDSDYYFVQGTFVGMTEAQRKIIRTSCRQMWVQSKKEAV